MPSAGWTSSRQRDHQRAPLSVPLSSVKATRSFTGSQVCLSLSSAMAMTMTLGKEVVSSVSRSVNEIVAESVISPSVR
jgi:hypothetical protein